MRSTDMRWRLSGIFALVAVAITTAACRKRGGDSPEESRNRKFENMMSGAMLVGHSTHDGKPGMSGEERYVIQKVSRLAGDTWMFQARLQYGSHDLTVPIPVPIKWAGDTPVISINTVNVPGLGQYTARVVLFEDRYAGTWSGKAEGGELFGKIVHASRH